MKVPNELISLRLTALAAIKAFRHPRSRRGIGQDTALKIRILDRKLRQGLKDYIDEHNGLIETHGIPKDPKNPKSPKHVPRDAPSWSAFQKESKELRETMLELPDTLLIKLSELQVRDEEDEWEKIDDGAVADLGELLEEPKEPDPGDDPKVGEDSTAPARRKREKKPRPE